MNNLKDELTWRNTVIVALVLSGIIGWAALMYEVMVAR